jgi:hypothetical protein
MVLRYLALTQEAWDNVVKPAIEKYYHIEGLLGNYGQLPLVPRSDKEVEKDEI